ncbi:MAG: transporter [Bacteroidetes bacterium HGW-Bacteroidetes-10]|nr:MAG: transporter [Bacteroidetes bacterium HGW-Bacteroidetes-10]
MEWFEKLLFTEGIAQSVLILALVIATGIMLSKIKVAKISFGVTWILFAGITFSHFGLKVDPHTLHFVKEFGLILFVYSVGLQVGPGFFSSFKKGGVKLNLLAASIVLLGVITTLIIKQLSGLPISTMTGILSGAITNTPGLGAAQQAFLDTNGVNDPTIATGYAVAYPLGVIGIILSMIFIKSLFRINNTEELTKIKKQEGDNPEETIKISLSIKNPAIFGKSIIEIKKYIERPFVISRVYRSSSDISIAGASTILKEDYRILVILQKMDKEAVLAYFGGEVHMTDEEWQINDLNVVPRRVLVTKEQVHGKSLANLKLGKAFGITVTRINRAGVDLVARPDLRLQIGDRLTIIGTTASIDAAANLLGNSMHKLREPNLTAIFLGIGLGILLGSIPLFIPGIPQPVKLGLAGGPLIVAILMSRFGPQYKLVTYTTMSANLMLREIGISLFLACVGLDAGGGFVNTIVNGGGALWILYGAIITVVPLLITGVFCRLYLKMNYFAMMGLLAGSTTDPPALAYSGAAAGNDIPAVSYATVYPLTMFLRVLSAQLLIMFG